MKRERRLIGSGLVGAGHGHAAARRGDVTDRKDQRRGQGRDGKDDGRGGRGLGRLAISLKMQPLGNYSLFHVQPGREFMIDGQTKHIADLKPGTVLTGTMVKKVTPVTVRTTSTLNGTVWWAQGDYVVLTLENGEQKGYQGAPVLPIHGRR